MGRLKREVIAVTGRGGAGKTTLTSIMVKILSAIEKVKLLVVDADPPTGLTYALGSKPLKTLGEIRQKLIENPEEKRRIQSKATRDVILDEAVINLNGISLLVMGRAEGPGCFCSINELLKYGIESLSKDFDVTLIDCEAGIEQVNRQVINTVNILVIVSDATVRGIQTAKYLAEAPNKHWEQRLEKVAFVINKVNKDNIEEIKKLAQQMDLEIVAYIPEDQNVLKYNLIDKPLIDLPDTSPSVIAVRELLRNLFKNATAEYYGLNERSQL